MSAHSHSKQPASKLAFNRRLTREEISSGALAKQLEHLLDRNPSKTVVYVGLGTCGLASGGQKVWDRLEELKSKGEIDVVLKKTGCIGYCQCEVMVDVKKPGKPRVSFANTTVERINKIVDSYIKGDTLPTELVVGVSESYPEGPAFTIPTDWKGVKAFKDLSYFKKQKRVVLKNCGTIDPDSIDEYIARDGYKALTKVLEMTSRNVVDEIKASGLRGRGGGGFPTGSKWEFAFNQPGPQKYIVMNADEGDPGAFMDRSVLEGDPHRVIEGMAIGGFAIGANHGYIYCRAEYPLAIEKLERAIADARSYGLLGKNILGTNFEFDLTIKKGAGAFVCGEE
ncbi:MAG TPA: NADH-quinone oxidoreductase subunit F, partial [Candidatus Ozemobacteraceae bacterium]|nr:NADH-quinone oxidoreductase subunit F [Candidatus Ozemobacteraceae bacterium]